MADRTTTTGLLEPTALSAADRLAYAGPIVFAEERHAGQLRKGSDLPYVVHPLEVGALLVRDYPARRALVSAGFLHDTLEDTETTAAELEARFGYEVMRLVRAVTKRLFQMPWSLDCSDADVVRLKAADCLSNVRATVIDVRREGPAAWRRFRTGERQKREYYDRLDAAIGGAIGGERLARELHQLVELLRAEA